LHTQARIENLKRTYTSGKEAKELLASITESELQLDKLIECKDAAPSEWAWSEGFFAKLASIRGEMDKVDGQNGNFLRTFKAASLSAQSLRSLRKEAGYVGKLALFKTNFSDHAVELRQLLDKIQGMFDSMSSRVAPAKGKAKRSAKAARTA
jgi:hypothetical protein